MYFCIAHITSLLHLLLSIPSAEKISYEFLCTHYYRFKFRFVLFICVVSLANHTHVELNWLCDCKSVCISFWSLSWVEFQISMIHGFVSYVFVPSIVVDGISWMFTVVTFGGDMNTFKKKVSSFNECNCKMYKCLWRDFRITFNQKYVLDTLFIIIYVQWMAMIWWRLEICHPMPHSDQYHLFFFILLNLLNF